MMLRTLFFKLNDGAQARRKTKDKARQSTKTGAAYPAAPVAH